jgi:hypothetical protein
MSLKTADMQYTKSLLTADSYYAYWDYWIHQIDHGKDHPVSVIWQDNEETVAISTIAIAPLFQLHHHVLYCSLVIAVSVWILKRCGFKLWEKY